MLKDLREQLEAVKSQMAVVLANTVNHITKSAPQELKDHYSCNAALVIKALVEGTSSDLCVKTMDIVEPNWVQQLPKNIEDILAAMKQAIVNPEPDHNPNKVIH